MSAILAVFQHAGMSARGKISSSQWFFMLQLPCGLAIAFEQSDNRAMTQSEISMGAVSNLKQKLLEALKTEALKTAEANMQDGTAMPSILGVPESAEPMPMELTPEDHTLEDGSSVYSLLLEEHQDAPLNEDLSQSSERLHRELQQMGDSGKGFYSEADKKTGFDDTLSMRGVAAPTEQGRLTDVPSSPSQNQDVTLESVISGGSMADLSGYKDLSKAPISFGDDDMPTSTLSSDVGFERAHHFSAPQQHFVSTEQPSQDVDTEFSGNVKTLIRLVNELPEGVTKQTGAQIIRLTMEAMGISMEDVLSEAQSAQSEMLDAVRANIKKIEEYKTVIRKLETDIKYYQGKANELSEIIDLFILSNTSSQKMPSPDDLGH
jgi:hypothetical protein